MKRTAIAILVVVMAFPAMAQRTMRDFIITMPDSLVEYLNKTKRTEMVDFYDMGVKAETFNLLQGSTVLDSLTSTFADISVNKSQRMQLALLPLHEADTLICMVNSFLGEAPESEVHFFNTQWMPMPSKDFLDEVTSSQLMQRPDTMDVERYDELVRFFDPVMIAAVMTPDSNLIFQLSTPMVTTEEKKQLDAIVLQKKFKWNRQRFN
ncbi:MAG: DUF3256 family protein [Prevotella sp.]|nr:DUF3256 family protein [Prevotella sp.]